MNIKESKVKHNALLKQSTHKLHLRTLRSFSVDYIIFYIFPNHFTNLSSLLWDYQDNIDISRPNKYDTNVKKYHNQPQPIQERMEDILFTHPERKVCLVCWNWT